MSLLAQGVPVEEILDDHPRLGPDDFRACLAYAHAVIAHDSLDAVAVQAGSGSSSNALDIGESTRMRLRQPLVASVVQE